MSQTVYWLAVFASLAVFCQAVPVSENKMEKRSVDKSDVKEAIVRMGGLPRHMLLEAEKEQARREPLDTLGEMAIWPGRREQPYRGEWLGEMPVHQGAQKRTFDPIAYHSSFSSFAKRNFDPISYHSSFSNLMKKSFDPIAYSSDFSRFAKRTPVKKRSTKRSD